MKLLHTSDWHLGKRLDDFSRIEEQQAVLDEICVVADDEQVDAVLVAGDLFDTFNPSTEAVDLFYRTVRQLTQNGHRPVIAIAGNHDSPDRIEAPDPLARACGIVFAGYPHSVVPPFALESGLQVLQSDAGFIELQLPATETALRIIHTSYANEFRLKTFLSSENSEEELRTLLQKRWQQLADRYCDPSGVNILVAHLFMMKKGEEPPEEPDDEKPILHIGGAQSVFTENIPKEIQYTALGHLHRMHGIDHQCGPVFYSGSPLSYSFAEAGQKKYVLIVETGAGETARVKEVELTRGNRLLRKRARGMEEALQWLAENCDALVELTLETETFITAAERRRLTNAHPGIIAIIPEITGAEAIRQTEQKQIDLSRSLEELFCDYFSHEKGMPPGDDLIGIFKEMLAEEE